MSEAPGPTTPLTRVYGADHPEKATAKDIARARVAAERLLGGVRLPHGVRAVSGDQSVQEALSQPTPYEAAVRVEAFRFWRVATPPCETLSWINKHPPARSHLYGAFSKAAYPCKPATRRVPPSTEPVFWGSIFKVSQKPCPVSELLVQVPPRVGGGTALRVSTQVAPVGARVGVEGSEQPG